MLGNLSFFKEAPTCGGGASLRELDKRWPADSGSHIILKHPSQASKRVVLPYHNKDLKRGTLQGILKQAGLSIKEFLKYL